MHACTSHEHPTREPDLIPNSIISLLWMVLIGAIPSRICTLTATPPPLKQRGDTPTSILPLAASIGASSLRPENIAVHCALGCAHTSGQRRTPLFRSIHMTVSRITWIRHEIIRRRQGGTRSSGFRSRQHRGSGLGQPTRPLASEPASSRGRIGCG